MTTPHLTAASSTATRDDRTRPTDDRYGVFALTEADRAALLSHLKRLDSASRRLRFGVTVTDSLLENFVRDFDLAGSLGFFRWGELLGVVSVVQYPEGDQGELAISILPALRGRGWGHELVRCALTAAYMRGIERVDIQFLSENDAMRHVTSKFPGHRESHSGEVLVTVDLEAWVAEQHFSFMPSSALH